jgi:DNA-binding MurR/RpiR family transcriptional regulator
VSAIDLEERIRTIHDGLSPSHRRLVEYLLAQEGDAAFSTARQLADALGMSEATVVRLAPALGYHGFPALQSEFRRRLASRISWKPYIHQAIESLPSDAKGILRQVIENDVASLQSTLASISLDLFERSVEVLRKARTIYFIGLRILAGHAIYGTMRMRLVHHRTQLLSSHFGDLIDQMLAFTSGDALVALSFNPYNVDTLRALRYAQGQGVRTILITDNPVSPPAKEANMTLVAHQHSSKLCHSLVTPLSVLNALITAAAVSDREVARRNIARAFKAVDEFGLMLEPYSRMGPEAVDLT